MIVITLYHNEEGNLEEKQIGLSKINGDVLHIKFGMRRNPDDVIGGISTQPWGLIILTDALDSKLELLRLKEHGCRFLELDPYIGVNYIPVVFNFIILSDQCPVSSPSLITAHNKSVGVPL